MVEVKKILFLVFTCLLLVALVLPACGGPAAGNTIKIGVIGPMQFVQGEHHWWGAEMARDEINAAGGVKIGDETYMIELIKTDSNEILSTTDAASAMERLITVDGADFVIGGFRTEAVFPMQEVAMDNKTIFLDCGAATLELCTVVGEDYDRYKYFFRQTPICNNWLVSNTLMTVGLAGAIMKQQTGIQRPLRVAICAEGAQWADAMVAAMEALIPAKLGMEVSGTWRPSPTATELNAEMTAIEQANTDIIMPIISGPLGIPYARTWGELEVPAASVGINVESQKLGFWEATEGYGNYETSLNTYAEGLSVTNDTKPFVDAFIAEYGEVPTYCADTYSAVYILAEAAERAGTLDSDAMVAELEKTDRIGTAGRFVFTSLDNAPLGNPHDVTYGPGYVTGIASQWQGEKMVCVWPNMGTGDWEGVKYGGTAMWQAPPRVIDKLKAEAATEAPPAPPEAPPEEGGLSFKAAEYTNADYGFSIQYPATWAKSPDLVTGATIAAFRVKDFIPGISLAVYDVGEGSAVEQMVAVLQQDGNKKMKVVSESEGTLADGTPTVEGKINYTSTTARDVECYYLLAQKGDKWVRAIVYTIVTYVPYDEAKFSEIVHTLTLK
jgi:branched-chain amino acid transport system substrate-binding protein